MRPTSRRGDEQPVFDLRFAVMLQNDRLSKNAMSRRLNSSGFSIIKKWPVADLFVVHVREVRLHVFGVVGTRVVGVEA